MASSGSALGALPDNRTGTQLINQLKGSKSKFTKDVKIMDSQIKNYKVDPDAQSATITDIFTADLRKLRRLADDIHELYSALILKFPSREAEYVQSQDGIYDQLGTVLPAALELIGKLPGSTRPVQQVEELDVARPRVLQAPKPNQATKPEPLTLDNTPHELRQWEKKFRLYYRTSNFDVLQLEDQQEYLLGCLESNLRLRVEPRLTRRTPIFGEASCFTQLGYIFLQRHPIYARREAFYMDKFTGKVPDLLAFYERLVTLAESAELGEMDVNTQIAYKALQECNDRELRRLASREEFLTLDVLRALTIQRTREYENMARHPAVAVHAVGDHCTRCGRDTHTADNCYAKTAAKPGARLKGPPRGRRSGSSRAVAAADASEEVLAAQGGKPRRSNYQKSKSVRSATESEAIPEENHTESDHDQQQQQHDQADEEDDYSQDEQV